MYTFWIKAAVWILTHCQVIAFSIHGNRVNSLDTLITNGTRNITELSVDDVVSNMSADVMETKGWKRHRSPSGSILATGELIQRHDMSNHEAVVIPKEMLFPAWKQMCSMEYKLVTGSNFTAQNSFLVSCDLMGTDHWSLYDYRKWISTNENTFYKYLPVNESLQFAFQFKCQSRKGSVTLPWPAKANYLWYVSVSNCIVYDFLAEFKVNFNTPDILRVTEFIDVEFKINSIQYFQVLTSDYNAISKQFDCGSEALERYVKRNCTESIMELTEPDVSTMLSVDADNEPMMNSSTPSDIGPSTDDFSLFKNESEMINAIAKFGQQNQKIQHQCVFQNFRYIDESYSSYVSKHHSQYMTERRQYPALAYFNMSHSRLTKVLDNFLQWRRYFPNMQYLDFSHNKIKYFSTLSDHGLKSDSIGVLDLRHNNITTLTSDDLDNLKIHSNTVYVDIRDNPLNCDCKLTNFVKELKNASSKVLMKYQYFTEVKCSQPEKFKGQLVSQLENDLCEALEVIILAAPLVILSIFFLVLVTVLVLTITCRKEIMILAFTRLHISLPCRKVVKNEDKAYDAFIAYSEADGDWVFDTLLQRLETTQDNNGPGFKLCIHHRDFPVGGCIADNIVDKVKESHHTVLILSNNFLLSHWCKYEFKTALTQSLMEKKRHLIIIIKEELEKHLIDRDLNRCLKTFTYVKADDRLFWDKIIFALSDHERIVEKQQKNDANGNNINNNDMEHNLQLRNNEVKNRNNNHGDDEQQNRLREPDNRMINQDIIQDGIWMI